MLIETENDTQTYTLDDSTWGALSSCIAEACFKHT